MSHEQPKHIQFQATGCMAVIILLMLASGMLAIAHLLLSFLI